jgi:hypothetical protein
MRPLLPFLLLCLACTAAVPPAPQPPSAGCTQFEGLYTFDPGQCRTSRGIVQLNVPYALFPDGMPLPDEPVLVGIHQDDCDELGIAARGGRQHDWLNKRSFAVTVGSDARWDGGVLTGQTVERSNLPAPVAIGSSGKYYWRLSRESEDALSYTSGYRERGLFFLFPYSAGRSVTCRLARSQ